MAAVFVTPAGSTTGIFPFYRARISLLFIIIIFNHVRVLLQRRRRSGEEDNIIFSELRRDTAAACYLRISSSRSCRRGPRVSHTIYGTRARQNNIILCLPKTFSFHVTRAKACVCVFSQRKRIAAGGGGYVWRYKGVSCGTPKRGEGWDIQ